MQWNLMKNILIVIVGALVVIFVLGGLNKPKIEPVAPVIPEPEVVAPVQTELTSLRGVKIYVDVENMDDGITSPLVLSGKAPGNWFFEASAPVVLTDWDGLIIAEGYVMANGEWMTTDYVPFSGTLTFVKPAYGERGTLIFQKDNPSGESQFDDAAEMTIQFK